MKVALAVTVAMRLNRGVGLVHTGERGAPGVRPRDWVEQEGGRNDADRRTP